MRIKIDIEGDNAYDTLTALANLLSVGRLLADQEQPDGRIRKPGERLSDWPVGISDEHKTIA